jgi:hypothetical protein
VSIGGYMYYFIHIEYLIRLVSFHWHRSRYSTATMYNTCMQNFSHFNSWRFLQLVFMNKAWDWQFPQILCAYFYPFCVKKRKEKIHENFHLRDCSCRTSRLRMALAERCPDSNYEWKDQFRSENVLNREISSGLRCLLGRFHFILLFPWDSTIYPMPEISDFQRTNSEFAKSQQKYPAVKITLALHRLIFPSMQSLSKSVHYRHRDIFRKELTKFDPWSPAIEPCIRYNICGMRISSVASVSSQNLNDVMRIVGQVDVIS